MENILVTGGLGYIGSHTVVQLLNNGYEVVIIDNLINSSIETINRIEKITNKRPTLYIKDIRKKEDIIYVLDREKIDKVIHFAAFKSVNESIEETFNYYENNIQGTLNLLEAMETKKIKDIIFSSTAAVYGDNPNVPYSEKTIEKPITPYATSKLVIEIILEDLQRIGKVNAIALRYFNPVGAHPSGLIGESPKGRPANLMPYITKVAKGEYDYVHVFGNDYETRDGTGVRDYIHVDDLAEGHIAALKYLDSSDSFEVFNLGSSEGYSVLEMINSFTEVNNIDVPYKIESRRPGDAPISFSDTRKAKKYLDWKARRNLNKMCKDAWNWERSI